MSASWRQDSNGPIVFRTLTHIPRVLFMFHEDKSKLLKKIGQDMYVRTAATTTLSVKKAERKVLKKGIHEMLQLPCFCKQNNLRFVTKI
jgi:hypothetical protein